MMQENKIKPKKIKQGSNIGLIAPSGKINIEKFEPILKNIENLGFNPIFTNRIFQKEGYLAGTDKNRLDDLHEMFDNKNIDAILCIRGGYGATRILPQIDYKLIKNNSKIFIGYSDITALNYAFYKKSDLITFHGIVGMSAMTDFTSEKFKNLFLKNISEISLNPKKFFRDEQNSEFDYNVIKHGIADGEIVGGNLTLMQTLIGTDCNINYSGKIVIIEEIDEHPYKIDRMLTHLFQATDLKKASAIVLGIFKDCSHQSKKIEIENTLTLKQIFEEKFADLKIPVIYGFPMGHIENQAILPFGIKAEINTFEETLTFKENIFTE